MKTLLTLLPFVAVFLIYNFVDHILGIIALVALIAVLLFIKWPTILMLRGNSKYNKGDKAGGLALMDKAYKTGKLDSNMVVYYSYCLLRENEDKRAAEILDDYIAGGKGTQADICRAKHNKAIILWKIGNIDAAFPIMKEVHSEMPATDTYGTLGLIYMEMAEKNPALRDEAMEFLKEAYDYNSDDRTIAGNLGEMYFRQGKLDEAEELYKKLIGAKQASPTPYYYYARVLMARGNYEDAEDMLNHALRYPFTGVTAVKREDVEAAMKAVNEHFSAELNKGSDDDNTGAAEPTS